jgi:hypothetical protein
MEGRSKFTRVLFWRTVPQQSRLGGNALKPADALVTGFFFTVGSIVALFLIFEFLKTFLNFGLHSLN